MPRRRAFTLVELLVVIGIIALLISILLPSLSRSRRQAMKVQCLSNLKQIGQAFVLYQNENRGSFPVHDNWGNAMGKKGSTTNYDSAPQFTGFDGEPGIIHERPLNRYLAVQVCKCPLDIGDTFFPNVTSCFEFYGTSYLVQWEGNAFATLHVTGPYPGNRPPMKAGYKGDMSKKIIAGDWNWHANRPLTTGRTLWHGSNNPNERRTNMLMGDWHAEDFLFPPAYDQAPMINSWDWDPVTNAGVAPDIANGYW